MTDLEATREVIAAGLRSSSGERLKVQQRRLAFTLPASRDAYRRGYTDGWHAAMEQRGVGGSPILPAPTRPRLPSR